MHIQLTGNRIFTAIQGLVNISNRVFNRRVMNIGKNIRKLVYIMQLHPGKRPLTNLNQNLTFLLLTGLGADSRIDMLKRPVRPWGRGGV